jgi:hypothetical protein
MRGDSTEQLVRTQRSGAWGCIQFPREINLRSSHPPWRILNVQTCRVWQVR